MPIVEVLILVIQTLDYVLCVVMEVEKLERPVMIIILLMPMDARFVLVLDHFYQILVDTGPDYKCTGSTPDVCAIRCGDGILDVTAPVE